jgi:hypothetical protein
MPPGLGLAFPRARPPITSVRRRSPRPAPPRPHCSARGDVPRACSAPLPWPTAGRDGSSRPASTPLRRPAASGAAQPFRGISVHRPGHRVQAPMRPRQACSANVSHHRPAQLINHAPSLDHSTLSGNPPPRWRSAGPRKSNRSLNAPSQSRIAPNYETRVTCPPRVFGRGRERRLPCRARASGALVQGGSPARAIVRRVGQHWPS